jgi:hypothetical protein
MNVSLQYSEELVRRAVRRFCWRKTGILYWATFAMLLAILVNALFQGDYSWLPGVLATVTVFGVALPIAVYRVQMNATLAAYRSLNNQPVRFSGDEIGFVVQATTGTAKLPWSTIAAIRRYNDLWLLEFRTGGFMTFPIQSTSAADREFLIERVSAHGGRIH